MGFSFSSLPSKYLGALLTDSIIKHSSWRDLLNNLTHNLNCWTFRPCNISSSLVLIKLVLQAMPTYCFSKMGPKSIISLQISFLCGGDDLKHKLPLVKWDMICLPKHRRGLKIRDPEVANNVMGAKIWWGWLKY